MKNLIRFYNQNRRGLILFCVIVFSFFVLLQVLNSIARVNNRKKLEQQNVDFSQQTVLNKEIISDKSSVSGRNVNREILNKDTDLINEFVQYCNQGNLENAYEMLSDDCKSNVYSNLQEFKSLYYDDVFGGEDKTFTVSNWANSVYRVKFTDNILSTGRIENNDLQIEDYITVINSDGMQKLNVGGYIENKNISRLYQTNDFDINVIQQDVYMDYTVFTFEINNNSNNHIKLDALENIESMYIRDMNEIKYYASASELSDEEITVYANSSVRVKIKYYCKFNSTREIDRVVFGNFILNLFDAPNEYEKVEIGV